jgi:hypothetical protein
MKKRQGPGILNISDFSPKCKQVQEGPVEQATADKEQ